MKMSKMKKIAELLALGLTLNICGAVSAAYEPQRPADADNFYQSAQLNKRDISFKSWYDLKIAGHLYVPRQIQADKKYGAIIIGHPMGAVKEQSTDLYAQKMAERGFVTLAIDLPYWGGSEGTPRNSVDTVAYADAFSSAVDYLGTRSFVDREKIGVIGICGSGSFAISAAKIDPRIKALATVSMYDMGAAVRSGLRHSQTLEQRREFLALAAEQRYWEFLGGDKQYTSGTVHEITERSSDIEKEFFDFYRTERGEVTPQGANSQTTTHPTLTSFISFMNFYPFNDIETIAPRPLLFIAGEHAHSLEFSEDAYRKAAEPKELYLVKGAGHVDLYDRVGLIPFDKLDNFFHKYLG